MSRRLIHRFGLAFACALLAACTSLPAALTPPRDEVGEFTVDGRFALKTQDETGEVRQSAGRLTWSHQTSADQVLLATPLGAGVAEIDSRPGQASLRSSDGQTHQAADVDRLVAEVTGQALPISRLPAWLLGRPTDDGQLERDALARPLRLTEAGWQIDYHYDDAAPAALPGRLTAIQPGRIELRLRLESWRFAP